ncbi:NAD(P)H-binding protein [Leuconostoc lactis]|uniref:NAD(P)H-binding protein n=1 Tax=Leuconostoc lactis TaxID=1246 RepID=UPI0025B0ED36|nr:NAD(P)H-binding protein [Leuconostoc lactis]MDN2650082.1 NAD(P)H-binding protein [Leuconostoc lactis]
MKVFVAGATGRVATVLLQSLVAQGHEVIAGARSPEKIMVSDHITSVKLDLHDAVTHLAQTVKDVAAIYFVAGSRSQDLLQTDAFGAVKMMQVAEMNHIQRFIMLSSAFSLTPEKWDNPALAGLLDYNIAKFFADNYLVNQTQLDYTILQATALVAGEGTHHIALNDASGSKNTIQNVGETLASLLNHDNTIKQVIQMSDGPVAIDTALAAI